MATTKRPPPVLDAGDYDMMTAALANMQDLPGIIAKAERCGVQCEEYRRNHEFVVGALQVMLKEWFPKGRPR